MTGKIMVDLRGTIPPTVLLKHAQGAFGYSGHNRAKCPAPTYGAELVAAGGWYAIVFEDRADRALDGYKAGRDDATYCVADARKQNYPTGCLLVATADFPARWSQITEYMRGWHEVVTAAGYVPGLYADGECIRGAKVAGYIAIGWLTCSGGFPGSHDQTGVDVKQRCAGESGQISIPPFSIDTNYLLTDFIHAWGQHTTTHPNPEELTVADIEAIMNALGGIKTEQAAQRAILDKLDADYLTKGKGVRQVIVHDEKLDEEQAHHDRAADVALGKG
jgi:hypothetical protein